MSERDKDRMDFDSEELLLLTSIREVIKGRQLDPVEHSLFFRKIDWQRLLDLAFENRVAALLHYSLEKITLVPDKQKRILRGFYVETAQKNLRIKATLSRILRSFKEEQIDVILLKGVVLAYNVWPNPAIRQMHDIDLMVPKQDVVGADRALRSMGFVTGSWDHSLEWYLEHFKDLPYYSLPDSDIFIELHHSWFQPHPFLKLDTEHFWGSSKRINFAGEPAGVFSPAHSLTHLCMHVSCEHFLGDNMRSLIDISLLVRQDFGSLDWKQFLDIVIENGLERLAYFPLYLSRKYLNGEVDFESLHLLEERLGLSPMQRGLISKVGRDFLFKADEKEFGSVGSQNRVLRRLAREILWGRRSSIITAAGCLLLPAPQLTPLSFYGSVRKSALRILSYMGKGLSRH